MLLIVTYIKKKKYLIFKGTPFATIKLTLPKIEHYPHTTDTIA